MIILESWTPRWRPQHDLENTSEVDKPKNTIIFMALNICSFHWTQKNNSNKYLQKLTCSTLEKTLLG